MTDAKPVVFTQVDTEDYDGIYDPIPLLVVGEIPAGGTSAIEAEITALQGDLSDLSDTVDANVIVSTALTVVPGSFADLAAVRTYLSTVIGEIKASPYYS